MNISLPSNLCSLIDLIPQISQIEYNLEDKVMIGRTTKKCSASIFQGKNIGRVYKGNRRELKDDQVIPKVTVLVVRMNEEEIKNSDFTHLRYYDQTNYVPFTKTIYYPRQQFNNVKILFVYWLDRNYLEIHQTNGKNIQSIQIHFYSLTLSNHLLDKFYANVKTLEVTW
eukprot:gene7507-11830_t